jgi:hypothetical protein
MQSGIYKHYKGGFYQFAFIAEHTETHERLVIYISLTGIDLEGPRVRARPLNGPEGFTEEVEWKDGKMRPRFLHIGDELVFTAEDTKET